MGLEHVVERSTPCDLAAVLATLAAAGYPSAIVMVDNALCAPSAAPPTAWRDVRLKTPAGTVSLKARPGGVAVVVFGNADAALLAAQQAVADAVRAAP